VAACTGRGSVSWQYEGPDAGDPASSCGAGLGMERVQDAREPGPPVSEAILFVRGRVHVFASRAG